MSKHTVRVVGLMSGTSLDGVDLVLVEFNSKNYEYTIETCKTYPYSSVLWFDKLKESIHLSEAALKVLDKEYGDYLGKLINSFLKETENINTVDFISSHGHTVFHKPDEGYTLQIGNGQNIADKTKLKVVCDFRSQDVALGGQGAPLVPIGDAILFSDYEACLNLGGFANISFQENKERIAFDICPVNTVLNFYAKKLGKEYDDKGRFASLGKLNESLFNKLNQLSYYSQKPPKSLGIEWVNQHVFPLINSFKISEYDILRTFTEHISKQILDVIKDKKSLLISGGGAYNDFLVSLLKKNFSGKIVVPNPNLIDYKEALIFALLGLLRLQEKNNCLHTVTGALKDHSSGIIFNPKNT